MIRCRLAPQPRGFQARVRQPDRAWLKKHRTGRPPPYWLNAWEDVANAFEDRCAYTAMWIGAPGTVDHFVSVDEKRRLAYEWSNYRYAAGWINSSKSKLSSRDIIDPFVVGKGWFEILLPSCQMVRTRRCPKKFRVRADNMLNRLHLGHDERVVRYRRHWIEQYDRKKIPCRIWIRRPLSWLRRCGSATLRAGGAKRRRPLVRIQYRALK